MPQSEHLADKLFERLLTYLTARRAFEIAVDEARRKGWTDEDIQSVTGFSPTRDEPALSRRAASPITVSPRRDRPAAA